MITRFKLKLKSRVNIYLNSEIIRTRTPSYPPVTIGRFWKSQTKADKASPYNDNTEFKRPCYTHPIRVTHPRPSQCHPGGQRHKS